MANTCAVKGFYNSQTDTLNLKRLVKFALLTCNSKDGINAETFYKVFLDKLHGSQCGFITLYNPEMSDTLKKLYKASLISLLLDLSIILDTTPTRGIPRTDLKTVVQENLKKDLGASALRVKTSDIISDVDEDAEQRKSLGYKAFISQVFGLCLGALNRMRHLFKANLRTATLFNLEEGTIVKSTNDLNDNLINMKNALYTKVVDFLVLRYPDCKEDIDGMQIYDEEGDLVPSYENVLLLMENHIVKGLEDGTLSINDLYTSSFRANANNTEIDAIYAYTSLMYFDDLILDSVNKFISFDRTYKNKELPSRFIKYQFSTKDSASYRKGFVESEATTAIDNTAKVIKFVIESIPLLRKGQPTGLTLGTVLLSFTFGKLFSHIPQLIKGAGTRDTKLTRQMHLIIDALSSFAESPRENATIITKIISENPDLHKNLRNAIPSLGAKDFDIITSLYEFVYAMDDDVRSKTWRTYKHKSIRALEHWNLGTETSLTEFSVVDDISGFLNDLIPVTYLVNSYSNNGAYIISNRNTLKDRRAAEKFKNDVNTLIIGMSLKQRENLQTTMQVERGPKSLMVDKVTLPHIRNPFVTDPNADDAYIDLEFTVPYKGSILKPAVTSDFEAEGESNEILTALDAICAGEAYEDLKGGGHPSLAMIDLSLAQTRDRLLSDNTEHLLPLELLFVLILQIIDERLHTRFLTEDGLKVFDLFRNARESLEQTNHIEELLLTAIKAQVVSDIYYEYYSIDENATADKFLNYVKTQYKELIGAINDRFSADRKTYFIPYKGGLQLRTMAPALQWADSLAAARTLVNGDEVLATSTNQLGTKDANCTSSFMAMKLEEELKKLLKPDSLVSGLLFSRNKHLIRNMVLESDFKNSKAVKNVRKLKEAELFYDAIVHRFWHTFTHPDTAGSYFILPTNYSDKTKIIQYQIDGRDFNLNWSKIHKMDSNDTMEVRVKNAIEEFRQRMVALYATTVGLTSKLILENTIKKYQKIFGNENLTIENINASLKNVTLEQLIEMALNAGVSLMLYLDYQIKKLNGKSVLRFNDLLVYKAKFAEERNVNKLFNKQKKAFIKDLVSSNSHFYVSYNENIGSNKSGLTYNLEELKRSNSPLARVILELYKDTGAEEYLRTWVSGGLLILAKSGNTNIINTYNDNITEINPLLEVFYYADTVLSTNLSISLTGYETNHPEKSKYNKVWDTIAKKYRTPIIMDDTGEGVGSTLNLVFNLKELKQLQKADIILVSLQFMRNVVDSDEVLNLDAHINDPNVNALILAAVAQGKKIFTSNPAVIAAYEGPTYILMDELYIDFKDMMALINEDLASLSNSQFYVTREFINDILEFIENSAQNTHYKRNLIAGATMHRIGKNSINGPASKIKVAAIQDMTADVFNFDGERGDIESMDGSAFVTMEQSILENKALNSLSVGADKKPIWHQFDNQTGTTIQVKFASYEINNERMRLSLNSNAALYNLYKKMTNLQWDGGIDLTRTTGLYGKNRHSQALEFGTSILGDNELYYRSYDEQGNVVYNQILDFGRDNLGYFTEEQVYGLNDTIKVYHYFDENSNHRVVRGEEEARRVGMLRNEHTINSLFELWTAMGGLYSCTLDYNTETFMDSDSSHYVVANFMNQIIFPKVDNSGSPISDNGFVTLKYYNLPLKDYMIGYAINLTALKKGATNVNSVEKWFNNDPLFYSELDIDWLGILLDAEHEVEEGDVITEPSQVISALESGGYTHSEVHEIYKVLGRIAEREAKLELDTIAKFISSYNDSTLDYKKVKNALYDIIGSTIIQQYNKSSEVSLTDALLSTISKEFNVNISHFKDSFKIPFSDPNIYSQILPTLISNINKKSIKRKLAGVGSVQAPGYNVMLYYNIDGNKYTFKDLVSVALDYHQKNNIPLPPTTDMVVYERNIVSSYLNALLNDPKYVRDDVDDFVPTDIVDIITEDGKVTTINLNNLDNYYRFKNKEWDFFGITGSVQSFRHNITKPKNLAPAIISFTRADNGKRMSVFDLEPFKLAYKDSNKANKGAVLQAFINLHKGFFEETDEYGNVRLIKITDLKKSAAEIIISNPYQKVLNIGNKSISQIKKEGPRAFMRSYQESQSQDTYAAIFIKNNEESAYISFESPRGDKSLVYKPYAAGSLRIELDPKSEEERLNVWYLNKDGVKLFMVGRYINVSDQYEYDETQNLFKDKEGNIVNNNIAKNLKVEDGTVYEYVLFVSRYMVTEHNGDYHNNHIKYYISIKSLKKAFNVKEGDTSAATTQKLNRFVTKILDDIYLSNHYETVSVNPTINKTSAPSTLKYVCNMHSVSLEMKRNVLMPIRDAILQQVNLWNDPNNKETTKTLDFKPYYDKYYEIDANNKYNSWLLSLKFISVRIPAQTLLSFMNTEAVAYTGSTTNTVYISHWMAWLQGTDYDIDKLYMMGLSFTNEGKLASWSNAFNYTSLEALEASLQLPFPRGLEIENKGQEQTGSEEAYKFNIDEYINNINLINANYADNKATRDALIVTEVARLFNNLYAEIGDNTKVVFKYNPRLNQEAMDLLDNYLIPHESTDVSTDGSKNYISLSINKVCSDLRNMKTSYSPVTTRTLSTLAEDSPLGKETMYMNMANPCTKYKIQVQNMEGKETVGVTATAQKIFFVLNHYFNEGLRSNDAKYLRNLLFSHRFNRIAGRASGNAHQVEITSLANCNLEDVDAAAIVLTLASETFTKLKLLYGITNEDITLKTEKWQTYKNEFLSEVQKLKAQQPLSTQVDLVISELISAATDNAKDPILSKLNCNSTFAKMYLYLIMVGFEMDDVIKFMTSPVAALIRNRTFGNMFDNYDGGKTHIKLAVREARGIINITDFVDGSTWVYNDETYSYEKQNFALILFSGFNIIAKEGITLVLTLGLLPEQAEGVLSALNRLSLPSKEAKTKDKLQIYIQLRLQGIPLKPLIEYVGNPKIMLYHQQVTLLSNYVEGLIALILEAQSQYDDILDYNHDLDEFVQVESLSNEFSLLGQTFLKLNLGLPTSKEDLNKLLANIKRGVKTRESEFKIDEITAKFHDNKNPNDSSNALDDLCMELHGNNPTLSIEYIRSVIVNAYAYNIIANFDILAWLEDKPLSEVMVGHETIGGTKISDEVQPTTYRKLVNEYYNVIKGSINIFDVIERVPLYASIFKLLTAEYFMDNYSSIKSITIQKIMDNVQEEKEFISDLELRLIAKYVNDILITSFLDNYLIEHGALVFPLPIGVEHLDSQYHTVISLKYSNINLASPSGRASFKKVFEGAMLQLQRTGEFGEIHIDNFRKNVFLQNLLISYDIDGSSYLSVPEDLMQGLKTPTMQKTILLYMDGIKQLASIDVNGHSLADWLMLYNLFVNQNLYGGDRLTSLFRNMVGVDSLLNSYFEWISTLDYNKVDEDVLKSIGYNMNDVLIRIAPFISESKLTYRHDYGPFVKTIDQKGNLHIWKREMEESKGKKALPVYKEFSMFPTLFDPSQTANYNLHLAIKLVYIDGKASLASSIMSDDVNEVTNLLIQFAFNSTLAITLKC